VAYFLVYGWILITSNYIPYVMDGNESYSSLVHASNLDRFSFSKSAGLTDEAASPHPEAHPFLHTHQGNFPRLFAFLIYKAGAQTIESQIIVTTFTIGVAAILFAFVFFSRLCGPYFALTATLLMMTDYILFTQWHVVTYRVWHSFFIFSSLLCVQGIGGSRQKLWIGLIFLNFLCLFYWELIFATFVMIMTGLYAGWTFREQWKVLIQTWAAQLTGAITALTVLCYQLITYLGWEDFIQDLYLTFIARNYAKEEREFLNQLGEFYSSHNLLFWNNLQSAQSFSGIETFLRTVFVHTFQIHTPYLNLLVFLIVGGWLLATTAQCLGKAPTFKFFSSKTRSYSLPISTYFLAIGLFCFVLTVCFLDFGLIRSETEDQSILFILLFFLAFSLLISLKGNIAKWVFVLAGRLSGKGLGPSQVRLFFAGLFLFGSVTLMVTQGQLYNLDWGILWRDLRSPSNHWSSAAVVCLAGGFGLFSILRGPNYLIPPQPLILQNIFPFLITGLLAFIIIYNISAGYLYSGYLVRYAPFISIHIDTLLAMALYLILAACYGGYKKVKVAFSLPEAYLVRSFSIRPLVHLLGATCLSLFFVGYWIHLQSQYIKLFPHDRFTFMTLLREPPFKGASFIANSYPLPTYTYTGEWAYAWPYDAHRHSFLTAETLKNQKFPNFLWFADRYTNQGYLTPSYFLCFMTTSMDLVIQQLREPDKKIAGCSSLKIVKSASSPTNPGPSPHTILVRDESFNDQWAILKLNIDQPSQEPL